MQHICYNNTNQSPFLRKIIVEGRTLGSSCSVGGVCCCWPCFLLFIRVCTPGPTYPAAAGFPLFYYMIEDLNTIQALYLSCCFLGLVSLLVSLTVLTDRMYLGLLCQWLSPSVCYRFHNLL